MDRDKLLLGRANLILFTEIQQKQIIDAIMYGLYILSMLLVSLLMVKSMIKSKQFFTFKLAIFYIVWVSIALRSHDVFLINSIIPQYKRRITAAYLMSRLLIYTTYGMLLSLWVRLYTNVFKVRQSIFKVRHPTTYIYIFIHISFLAIFLPIMILNQKSKVYLLINHVYILYVIVFSGLVAVGFLIFGYLIRRESKKSTKIDLNERLLVISIALSTLLWSREIFLIQQYIVRDSHNAEARVMYRCLDDIIFALLNCGLALVLDSPNNNNTPRSSKQNSNDSSGNRMKLDTIKDVTPASSDAIHISEDIKKPAGLREDYDEEKSISGVSNNTSLSSPNPISIDSISSSSTPTNNSS